MNSGKIAVVFAALVTVLGIGWAFVRGGSQVAAESTPVAAEKTESQAVHVDELAERPSDHAGEITLRAVVARVNEEAGLFSVIDAREFESCSSLTCAKHYVPVKFSGRIPEPKSIVQLTGHTVKTEKGLVFEAKRLEAVK